MVNNIKKSLLSICILLNTFLLFAQTESEIILSDNNVTDAVTNAAKRTGGGTGIGVFIRMIVVLLIVIGLIYGVFWFIKNKTNAVKTDDEFLRRVAYIDVAPGKSVEVVTLIDKAYLIGVTDSQITLLGEIDDKELIQAMNLQADKTQNTKKPVNFAEVLDMFTAKGKKKNAFSDNESTVDELLGK